MIAWINIAIRNIFKNGRRSLYTITSVVFGFAAINVFGSFTAYIYHTIQTNRIYLQGEGHLVIFRRGYLDEGRIAPLKFLITVHEMDKIRQILSQLPKVALVSPQLRISGLISNGSVSTVFVGHGIIPSHVAFSQSQVRGPLATLKLYEGRELRDDTTYGVGLSTGLSHILDLKEGDHAMAMAQTVDGMMNALDMTVFQTFEAPLEALNDKMMKVPLEFARSLYDTDGAGQIAVLLSSDADTLPVQAQVISQLSAAGLDMEVVNWMDHAPDYHKVRNMLNIIFIFIFVIVFIIIIMSIMNTISMTIMERTRETGTLRALGLKRFDIVRLFALESGLLGGAGSLVGLCLAAVSCHLINAMEITWIPPQFSIPIPLKVHLVPAYLSFTFVFMLVLSIFSVILPARKSAYKSIVEALGHV